MKIRTLVKSCDLWKHIRIGTIMNMHLKDDVKKGLKNKWLEIIKDDEK